MLTVRVVPCCDASITKAFVSKTDLKALQRKSCLQYFQTDLMALYVILNRIIEKHKGIDQLKYTFTKRVHKIYFLQSPSLYSGML